MIDVFDQAASWPSAGGWLADVWLVVVLVEVSPAASTRALDFALNHGNLCLTASSFDLYHGRKM